VWQWEEVQTVSKERLLELMKDAPDHEQLKMLPQSELAIIFCERQVYSAKRMGCFQKPVDLPFGIEPPTPSPAGCAHIHPL